MVQVLIIRHFTAEAVSTCRGRLHLWLKLLSVATVIRVQDQPGKAISIVSKNLELCAFVSTR